MNSTMCIYASYSPTNSVFLQSDMQSSNSMCVRGCPPETQQINLNIQSCLSVPMSRYVVVVGVDVRADIIQNCDIK